MLIKDRLKKILCYFVGSGSVFKLSRISYLRGLFPYVQAVTYHDTPNGACNNLRNQLEWYQNNFANCNLADLRGLLTNGVWNYDKPGLIISFDDGLRSNFDVALPLLEEYGFTGWFMVPSGWLDLSSIEQIEFAKRGLIKYDDNDSYERIAISWDELKEIEQRGHIVSCHSMNHRRLSDKLTSSELEVEINDAKSLLESKLEHSVDIFTWVGGEENSYSKSAFKKIKDSGFNYAFCTNCAPIIAKQSPFFLERYHVEPSFSEKELRLTLGGFYDILYSSKRKRIAKKISTTKIEC